MMENMRLFVGIKVSKKLQRALDDCPPRKERYFKGDKPESLQIATFGEERIIGRFLPDGYPAAGIEDVSRNVRSIITLITQGSRIDEDSVRIYAGLGVTPKVIVGRKHQTQSIAPSLYLLEHSNAPW